MMKPDARKRKKICIIAVWLVGVFITTLLLFLMVRDLCIRQGKEDLLEHADIVAEQIPAIIENDFYSQAGYLTLQFDKLKALSFALEFYEDAEQAKDFLDDYVQNADVDALALFDRNGNKLYCSDPDFKVGTDITAESFERMRKEKFFEKYVQALTYSDEYFQSAFTADSADTEDYDLGWFVQDRYLLVMRGKKSEARSQIENTFSWTNVLRKIRIGTTGHVLAIDENSGKVLSFGAANAEGDPMESLDIFYEGDKKATKPEDLLPLFDDPKKISELKVSGQKYYASRISVEGVLMLALLPSHEISIIALNAAIPLAALLLFFTGLVMIYIILHIDAYKNQPDMKEGYSLTSLKGKLGICIMLATLALLVLNIYLQALIVYSNSFSYCRGKLNNMLELLENNDEALKTLKALSDEEYLTRCRGAKSILEHAEKADVNRDYLNSLCDAISLNTIHIYDEDGNVTLTNSLYDRWTLDSESPFFDLLKGRPWKCGELEMDKETGEFMQLIGASLRDADNRTCGAVLFTVDPIESRTITDNLSLRSVFQQICLKDNTLVLTVDSNDMTIDFQAKVEEGSYKIILASNDDKNLSVGIFGIDENLLRDDYNGDMRINRKDHFVSIGFLDDDYYMVMLPKKSLSGSNTYPIILCVAASFILLLILYAITCFLPQGEDVLPGTSDEAGAEAAPETEAPKKKFQWAMRFQRLNESFFQSLLDEKNASFDERWPKDGISWKDKTIGQKFSFCFRAVLILAFILAIIHTILAGENSIWYYCLIGDWVKGINIFSLTTCVICIYVLVIIRVLGHRLLYLTARVMDAKGETICHLLDSTQGYVLFIIGVFLCLSAVGVSLMALSLTGGVAGVIFGIGCQNIVADILAGIIMVFEGIVYAGDFVSYNGSIGSVLSIGVRTTTIKYYGNVTVIRNNDFKNFVKKGATVRARVLADLWIDLRENLEDVERIIERDQQWLHDEILGFCYDEILEGPEYRGIVSISENGYALSFAVYLQGRHFAPGERALKRALKLFSERNHIRLAMPQIVINEPVPLEAEAPKEEAPD